MSPECVALLARRCRCRCRGRRGGSRLQRADDEVLARRLHDLLGDEGQLVDLYILPKRCIKALGQVAGVSKPLRCRETGILRRFFRCGMAGMSQGVPSGLIALKGNRANVYVC